MNLKTETKWYKSLTFTLFIWFTTISITPLLFFEYFNYQNRIQNLEKKYEETLNATASSNQTFIQNWFADKKNSIFLWSQSQNTINLFTSLYDGHELFSDLKEFFESYEYALIVDKYKVDLDRINKQYDYIYDILLIDLQGNILFTIKKEEDVGLNLNDHNFASTKLTSSFIRTIKTGQIQFSDLEHYTSSKDLLAGFLTAPIIDNDGNFVGIMAVQILPKYIKEALNTKLTGHKNYLVGEDGLSRSDISLGKKALTIKVKNKLTESWRETHLSKEENTHKKLLSYANPSNKMVMGLYKNIEILGVNWILISEVEHVILFADKNKLLEQLLLFLLITIAIIVLIAIYLSRTITRPIKELNQASLSFTQGNRDLSIIKETDGEVGELSRSFKLMLIALITKEDELKIFANKLEERVNKEVELNSLKDKQLLTQSKIAQEKLHKSLTLFGENVISSNTNLNGIITYVSQALCDISGYDVEELLGAPHNILRHPDMSSQLFEEMWRTIHKGEIWNGEIKNRKKSGEYYWVKTSIMPDIDENGIVIGYRSIRHDITAEKIKEEFMANMSHELRTPLNSIIGFSGILKKKIQQESDNKLIVHINNSANSLLILINDILDLAKIKDSKFTIEPFEFNAYDEMNELCKKFEGLSDSNTLVCKSKVSENLKSTFYADWLRINQIILNLISNAIKFTPKDGLIGFEGDYKDNNLVITISDNGIGMSKEVQDKIFKPFEQADGSTTRKYGGTGLGLSITQNLVELMNGKIELESEEGKGTTFIVSIPMDKVHNSTAKVTIDSEEEKEPINIHVLVAEDNKTNQMLIKMLLDEFAITCDIANDGLEAIEMYDPNKHKLVLMDENMPNMNGLEAMRIIKEKHMGNCGPIIAVTANAMDGDRERFLGLGMDGYVSKPIDDDELYAAIKESLFKV